MSKKRIYGLDREQIGRLLSLGTGGADEADSQGAPPPKASEERPGAWIGRYHLLRVLGEGGMGIVYLAQQEQPLRRQVAVKVIKPGMDSKRVIARFEAERQALALLDHPNIAHVYDAGTTEAGRPYFVMEYVEGSPITEYCDAHKLTIPQRLRLFRHVCLAVQHAHQKGIIHRDLKPSNILLSAERDQPIPKIIDFGVAKATAAPLTERTLFTEDAHLLGTPEYMSPEQADIATEDIDTRSDVYSLGVLLYVLLAGILPYDSETFRQGGVEHMRKIIRESDPKTPSTRLTRLGDEAAAIAKNRGAQVHKLAIRLRRELEWIPLKAMRKDRAERYRSASELADDIDNYLNGRPLVAGPPSVMYQIRKFVRRHEALVTGVTAVLVVSLIGALVSVLFAIKAEHARSDAETIAHFLETDVLGSVSRARVGEATVSFVLDAAAERLGSQFADRPLVEASIRWTLASTYRELGESAKAEQHLLHAIRLYGRHYGPDHPTTRKAPSFLAWIYEDQGRYREMETLSKHLGLEGRIAIAQYHLGNYRDAASFFARHLPTTEEDTRPFTACNLARAYAALARYEEAERLFLDTLAGKWPEDADNWKRVYSSALADMYREQGRYVEAEQLFNKTLETQRLDIGDAHVHTLGTMCGLARLYVDQDRYEEAQELLRDALPIARRRLRERHPVTLQLVNALAVIHTKQKGYDEAEGLFDEALTGRQHELGADHPDTLQTVNDFGVLRREQQRHKEAESLLRRALDGRKRKLGPDHPACFESMHELGVLYIRQARYEDAEPLLLETYNGREAKLGPDHPHTLDSLRELVNLYESWPKPDEAAKWRTKRPGRAAPGE